MMVDIQIFLIKVLDILLIPFPKMLLDYKACAFPCYLAVDWMEERKPQKYVTHSCVREEIRS